MSESAVGIVEMVGVIVRGLVDSPDAVTVTITMVGSQRVCVVRVAEPDLGKIIGKSGSTARAIRLLVEVHSMKSDQRVAVDLGSHANQVN